MINKRGRTIFIKHIFFLSALIVVLNCGGTSSKTKEVQSGKIIKECSSDRKPTKYDATLLGKDSEQRLKRAGRVSGILEELNASRNKFLNSGDYIELFPALYFHVTKTEFDRVLENKTKYPIIKMDMIIKFFDAYKQNRKLFDIGGVDTVESNWKNYYRKSLKANNNKAVEKTIDVATDILIDGIDAHVVYDIPRFVRDFVSKSAKREDLLKKEFDSMDAIFVAASEKANADIVKALNLDVSESKKNLYKSGASYIIFARKKAWEMGVSKKPLLTEKPQPKFNHSSDSRAFFPKELLESGICKMKK